VEDPYQAGEYERAVKQRPAPFEMHLRGDGETGKLRVAVNAASLAIRAFAQLPKALQQWSTDVQLSWRLVKNEPEELTARLELYTLSSNKKDPEAKQPASFGKVGLSADMTRNYSTPVHIW